MKATLLLCIALIHSVAAAPLAAPIIEVKGTLSRDRLPLKRHEKGANRGADLVERADDDAKKCVPCWDYYDFKKETTKRDAHPASDANPEAADAVKKPVPDWTYYSEAPPAPVKRGAEAESADAVRKPVPDWIYYMIPPARAVKRDAEAEATEAV